MDNLNQIIIQAVLQKPIFSRIAALSKEDKEEVKKKVKDKIKGKKDEKEKKDKKGDKGKKEEKVDKKKKDKNGKKPNPFEKKDEKGEGKVSPKGEGSEKPPEDMVSELQGELDSIAEDGKVSPSEILGLVDKIMEMMNLVLHAKLPKESTIASRVANSFMADKIAAKGVQRHRKDKDTMSDTGGSSKGRKREPDSKPSREDHRKSPKRKMNEEKDPDNDKDPDKKAFLDEALSLFAFNPDDPDDQVSQLDAFKKALIRDGSYDITKYRKGGAFWAYEVFYDGGMGDVSIASVYENRRGLHVVTDDGKTSGIVKDIMDELEKQRDQVDEWI